MARTHNVFVGLVLTVAVGAPLAWSLANRQPEQRSLTASPGAQPASSTPIDVRPLPSSATPVDEPPTPLPTEPASNEAVSAATNPLPASPAATSRATDPVVGTIAGSRDTTASSADVAGVIDPACPASGHGALIDRKRQRAALCTDGRRGPEFVVTTAISMPDPGTYTVYAKDLKATSTFGGHFSTMTHFVAFSYGERTGARVAFHSLPKLRSGEFVQDPATVGKVSLRGESNGCIRVLPDQAVVIWDHLDIGSKVVVLN